MTMQVEQWTDQQGRQWRRVPATNEEAYILSADLGQSQDPTALAVLRYRRTPSDQWKTTKGLVNVNVQQSEIRFDVLYVERLKLGTPYPNIVAYVGSLLERQPLRDGGDFLIDETGVGRAVGDMFDAAGLRPVRVSITAGNEAVGSGHHWHVPKGLLVSTLDAKLHSGELKFAKDLADGHALADELKDFQRNVTAAGRATFQARTGRHDDLVLAVAIATWWASERRRHATGWSTPRGTY